MAITDTTPQDASDGIWFNKGNGSFNIDCVMRKAAANTASSNNIGQAANGVNVDLGFYYDGNAECQMFVNGNKVASLNAVSANLPGNTLTPTLYVCANSAAAKTVTWDYVMVAQER
jgi:hypothetical protein